MLEEQKKKHLSIHIRDLYNAKKECPEWKAFIQVINCEQAKILNLILLI